VLLHRWLGPLIFLAVVVAVFQVVFLAGQPLSDWLTAILTRAGAQVALLLPDNWLRLLLRDGLWNGVQAVLVFLPQILLLFLFIGILEDSGYLARAALIADRVMRAIGLNGKAFIPLLSAYACAVPAIMATRTIENKRERLATIMVAPFMTCSARLPIYTLIIAAFIPNRLFLGGILGMRAMVMLSLYALGFLAALVTARLLNSSVMKATPRRSSWSCRSTAGRRCRAGAAALRPRQAVCEEGRHDHPRRDVPGVAAECAAGARRAVLGADQQRDWAPGPLHRAGDPAAGLQLEDRHRAAELDCGARGDRGHAGHAVWRGPGDALAGLQAALRGDMTLGGAIALVVFFAFAMQCTSTLAVVRRETNSWKLRRCSSRT
jgi:ferrous iron transport protein B